MSLKLCPTCNKQARYGPDEHGQHYCKIHKLNWMQSIRSKKCAFLNCTTKFTFGTQDELGNFYCSKHKNSEMTEIRKLKCEKCDKIPCFNFKGELRAKFCKEHAEINMVDVKNKKCEKCDKQPCFNFKGKLPAKFCKDHAEENMIDIISKKCEKCDKRPYFNFKDEIQPKFCKEHADIGMVDIKNKKCEKCDKIPYFNFKSELRAKFCREHAEENMVNIISKKCEKCDKIPCFNFKEEIQPRFCKDHAEENMIDIKNKKCEKCDKRPIFNFKEEIKPRFCKEHAEENMMDIKHKKCEKCDKRPYFNFKNELQAKFCKEHAEENMIDIKHKKCKCDKQPRFNYIGYSPICCAKCKEPKMILNPLKKCEIDKCKKLTTKIKDSIFYCDIHSIDGAIDIHEICTICYNQTEIGKQVCDICIKIIDNPVKTHLKELQIKRHLENAGIEIHSYDKIVGESKRRPDFIIKQSDNNIIVIECDEFQHQHKSYPCECEITRMKQIYFDLFKPIKIRDDSEDACAAGNYNDEKINKLLFIRYNPDQYLSEFSQISTIKRLEYLEKYIDNFNFDKMDVNLGVKYLFYDYFISTTPIYDLDKIDPYQARI